MNIDLYDFKTISESLKESEIINKKLTDKENPPSLEDILDMDGIINEYNRKNEKLIDFFTKQRKNKENVRVYNNRAKNGRFFQGT